MSSFSFVLFQFAVILLRSVWTFKGEFVTFSKTEDCDFYDMMKDAIENTTPGVCRAKQTCALQVFDLVRGGYLPKELVTCCQCPKGYECREAEKVDLLLEIRINHKCYPQSFWKLSESLAESLTEELVAEEDEFNSLNLGNEFLKLEL